MTQHHEATAQELEFEPLSVEARRSDRAGRDPASRCVVCGRARARLSVAREHGHPPAKLCLRCHHSVMQQRKMLRANLHEAHASPQTERSSTRRHHLVGDAGLIVPRGAPLGREAKYAELTRRRHRAQVAVRRALTGDLLDRAG